MDVNWCRPVLGALYASLFAQKEQQARKQTIKATTNKH